MAKFTVHIERTLLAEITDWTTAHRMPVEQAIVALAEQGLHGVRNSISGPVSGTVTMVAGDINGELWI